MDAVYNFNAPHDSVTVQECAYADWQCDYYVRLETDKYTTLPANSILLGGNYGSFKWNGFTNPEVPTNPENLNEYYNVNTVVYDFDTKTSTITNYPN